jgi:tRNA (guanine37-N1)-methyltransferase
MRAPCVRVPVAEGEATRQALLEADLLDHDLEIEGEDGWLYLPVTDADAVDRAYELTERDFDPRETHTLPEDLLDEPPSYERVGDIVLLHEDDPERARAIAETMMTSDLPVKTVLNRASEVRGTERVREWDVLAGDGTETVHTEYGCEFAVDLATVYFSARSPPSDSASSSRSSPVSTPSTCSRASGRSRSGSRTPAPRSSRSTSTPTRSRISTRTPRGTTSPTG